MSGDIRRRFPESPPSSYVEMLEDTLSMVQPVKPQAGIPKIQSLVRLRSLHDEVGEIVSSATEKIRRPLKLGFLSKARYSDLADSMTMKGTPLPSSVACSSNAKQVLVFPAPVTPTMRIAQSPPHRELFCDKVGAYGCTSTQKACNP